MSRTLLPVATLFSASSLLLVDSSVKGVLLLLVAAVVAVMLRRDSAATRHFVWLLALVAMLVLPVLSAILPQWRVLPEWARIVPEPVGVNAIRAPRDAPGMATVEVPRPANPGAVKLPSAPALQPSQEPPAGPSTRMISEPALGPDPGPAPPTWNWTWYTVLPLVWTIGFCLFVLRLVAARFVLWNTERQATAVWSAGRSHATQDRLETALELSRRQFGIRRPIKLLVHSEKTIPVVWGILRPRLLLPMTARHWSDDQLRSVLLHELAHIKRRDIMARLLAQLACALHWFNPLVWFAAWRLAVERERACDDLVLASGVRASAYAGHLLDVVAGHSPPRWARSCGLTMARKSSLEGRLVAVLSQNLNRRRVTSAAAAAALALGAAVAIPVSMLRSAADTTYSTIEINDVRSGEEMTRRASLPFPAAPGAPSVVAELQTGERTITATSPEDVALWSARGAGQWPMPGGVTLEVKQRAFHAADVQTSAILTWPKDAAGVVYAYTIGLAADAFGNRDPWHLVWEKDATVLWAMSGQMQSWRDQAKTLPTPDSVTRIDFSDRMRITSTTWGHQPEAMPAGVRAAFLSAFHPLPASPRNPADVSGRVRIGQAHDVRPIAELLNGVWRNKEGRLDVRLAFPDREMDPVEWTVDFKRQVGASVVHAGLRRIDSPANNSVLLWMPPNAPGFVDEQDILATLRRGPDNTLLLDIHQRAKFPGNEAATGIVLVRENAGAAVSADGGAEAATGPPGAQPQRFPPPPRDAVRGLDLSRITVRRIADALAQTPDLYIPDPENPGAWTQRTNVFQMPLAEHTWLKYPAGSGHFYITHRPGGTWQNEQLYGPLDGDPFEVLKLEALLREQLQPGGKTGDPRYRLRLMFRTGDPALIRRAVRLIEPELARRFEAGAAGLLHHVALLEIAREALRDEAAAFRQPELSDVAGRLRRSLAAAEAAIDKINDSVPDAEYQSVTHLQPKLKAEIPDSLWGRPVDGLRLALVPRDWPPESDWNELPPVTPRSASLMVRPGHEQRYQSRT